MSTVAYEESYILKQQRRHAIVKIVGVRAVPMVETGNDVGPRVGDEREVLAQHFLLAMLRRALHVAARFVEWSLPADEDEGVSESVQAPTGRHLDDACVRARVDSALCDSCFHVSHVAFARHLQRTFSLHKKKNKPALQTHSLPFVMFATASWMCIVVAAASLATTGAVNVTDATTYAASPSSSNATVSDGSSTTLQVQTVWLWSSSVLFFFLLYFVVVLSSYPFVRYRTGIPLLFLVLIIVFPPSFFFLLAYLAILRLGYLSTLWYVLEEREAQEREERRVARATQRERRTRARV